MSRVIREVKRIIRKAKSEGYTGDFAVMRESVMEDIQVTCGRAIAENVQYQIVIGQLMRCKNVCEYCEDYEECQEHKDYCLDFLLRFPDNEEAVNAFNECYKNCEERVHD